MQSVRALRHPHPPALGRGRASAAVVAALAALLAMLGTLLPVGATAPASASPLACAITAVTVTTLDDGKDVAGETISIYAPLNVEIDWAKTADCDIKTGDVLTLTMPTTLRVSGTAVSADMLDNSGRVLGTVLFTPTVGAAPATVTITFSSVVGDAATASGSVSARSTFNGDVITGTTDVELAFLVDGSLVTTISTAPVIPVIPGPDTETSHKFCYWDGDNPDQLYCEIYLPKAVVDGSTVTPWRNVRIVDELVSPGQEIVPDSYRLIASRPDEVDDRGWPHRTQIWPLADIPASFGFAVEQQDPTGFTVTMDTTGDEFAYFVLRYYVTVTDPTLTVYQNEARVSVNQRTEEVLSWGSVNNTASGFGNTAALVIVKGDGERSTGTIVNDANTMRRAAQYDADETRDVLVTIRNDGSTPLHSVVVTDTVLAGHPVEALSCTFPGEAAATVGAMDQAGLWSVSWPASFSGTTWAVGESFLCSATLTMAGSDDAHTDVARVTALTVGTNQSLTNSDPYNAVVGEVDGTTPGEQDPEDELAETPTPVTPAPDPSTPVPSSPATSGVAGAGGTTTPSGAPTADGSTASGGGLAVTGASVAVTVAVAGLLLAGGIALRVRRRQTS